MEVYGLTLKEKNSIEHSIEARAKAWDRILLWMTDLDVKTLDWSQYDKLRGTLKYLQDGLPGYEGG